MLMYLRNALSDICLDIMRIFDIDCTYFIYKYLSRAIKTQHVMLKNCYISLIIISRLISTRWYINIEKDIAFQSHRTLNRTRINKKITVSKKINTLTLLNNALNNIPNNNISDFNIHNYDIN